MIDRLLSLESDFLAWYIGLLVGLVVVFYCLIIEDETVSAKRVRIVKAAFAVYLGIGLLLGLYRTVAAYLLPVLVGDSVVYDRLGPMAIVSCVVFLPLLWGHSIESIEERVRSICRFPWEKKR